MMLIIGGAYQGKRAYAEQQLRLPARRIVGPIEAMVRTWLQEGKDPIAEIDSMLPSWKHTAVLLTDIGSGIVPMDAEDRAWREAVGRCGTYLALHATRVVRVFCGMGTDIKHA